MWNWILKIVDFIRAILSQKAESAQRQAEEDKETEKQRAEVEAQVEDVYDKKAQEIPVDGGDLVDYWSCRGVQSGNQPTDQSAGICKGGTKPK